jgi:hypothetical protein
MPFLFLIRYLRFHRKWLNGIDKVVKERIRIGVCALLWAIWNCQNDIVFNSAGSS